MLRISCVLRFLRVIPLLIAAVAAADNATPQRVPHIASDGQSLLVIWSDGANTLRAARIAPDGADLDGDGIVVTSAYAGASAVTFDGRDWLVAYTLSPNRVAFRRITADARLSPETSMMAGIDPTGAADDVRVAAAPDGEFAIVWTTLQPGSAPIAGSIRGSIDGQAPFQIGPPGAQSQPDVAWNGDAFRVAWVDVQSYLSQPPGNPHTEYLPVSVTVATLRPGPQVTVDATYKSYAGWPRLAGGGVVWPQLDGELVYRGVAGAMSVRGVPFPYIWSDPPAAAVDDAGRILVVWPGGATFVADGATPFATGIDGVNVDVAATHHGFVVAYARVVDGVSRVFVRTLDFPPRGRAARH